MEELIQDEIFERSMVAFNVVLKDENLDIVTPKTASWQLMRSDGTIINNRTFANCPLQNNIIVLSGDDLAIFEGSDDRIRIVAIKTTYDSTLGNDLPCNKEFEFFITKMISIEDEL